MKELRIYQVSLFLALFIFIVAACNDDDDDGSSDIDNYNCEFVQNDADMDGQIDNAERALMEQCDDNSYMIPAVIESNLVGEWKIVGFGTGWAQTPSQPCAYLVINDEQLTFKFQNAQIDTTTTHSWELVQDTNGGFSLEVSPLPPGELAVTVFAKDYMYSDATPVDGNMYIYERVK